MNTFQQFLTGVCNGIAYKRTGASASEIRRDADHHGAKMAAIEKKINAQDGKIMVHCFIAAVILSGSG